MRRLLLFLATLTACGGQATSAPLTPAPPCFTIHSDAELRAKDAEKMLADLTARIELAPEDEQLRHPKSVADVRTILRRDAVYLFADAAAYARSLDTTEGRFMEAHLLLFLGESQLVASQVLSTQVA